MKKLLIFVLTFAMFIGAFPAAAVFQWTDNIKLSEMSDGEIIAFLKENSITIPAGVSGSTSETAKIVRKWIKAIEENPGIEFNYSIIETRDTAVAVKQAVLSYYGNPIYERNGTSRGLLYELAESTLYDGKTANIPNYNCYGYVLGRTFEHSQINQYAGTALSSSSVGALSISSLAEYVEEDLNVLGYECVNITGIRPVSGALVSGQTAIALKKTLEAPYDYHFMRLEGSVWRHKIGGTSILTYNYLPDNQNSWLSEYVEFDTLIARRGSWEYDSDVVFVAFKETHSLTTETTNYHSGIYHIFESETYCLLCGEVVDFSQQRVICDGPPCNVVAKGGLLQKGEVNSK